MGIRKRMKKRNYCVFGENILPVANKKCGVNLVSILSSKLFWIFQCIIERCGKLVFQNFQSSVSSE